MSSPALPAYIMATAGPSTETSHPAPIGSDSDDERSPYVHPKGYTIFGPEAEQELLTLASLTKTPLTQLSAVFQYHFGQAGQPKDRRTTKQDARRSLKEFVNPTTVDWHIEIPSPQEVMRLLHGSTSFVMDEKWFIFADGPVLSGNGNGNDNGAKATVNFHRSWTGTKVASLELTLSDPGSAVWKGHVSRLVFEGEITVSEGDEADTPEKVAKFMVLTACSHVLRVRLQPVETVTPLRTWDGMENQPWVPEARRGPVFRAVQMSEETEEDWKRLGNTSRIRFR